MTVLTASKRLSRGTTRRPTIAWLRSAWGVAYTMYLGTESSMTEAKLTIGHIAHAAAVNVETVRY
jgi:hypothetical protein